MRVTTLLTLTLFLLAGAADARNVLFDQSHGQAAPLGSSTTFSMARAALTGDGHTLSVLNGGPGSITAAALTGIDVFYTDTMDQSLIAPEIAALQAFIAGGGGVVVGHNGGFSSDSATPSVNMLLAPYGIAMAGNTSFPQGVVVSGFEDHCLTQGIADIGLDFVRLIDSIAFPGVDLTTGATDVLAVADQGTGWVIVFGDHSCWTNPGSGADWDLDDFDNRQLLLNIFNYTACTPVSVEKLSWGAVKASYR